MKKILLVFLLVLCFVPLFAVSSFYKQLAGMFLVDLTSTYFMSHSSNAHWAEEKPVTDYTSSSYYDKQIIAVLGVTGAEDDVYLTFDLESSDWLYLIDSTDTVISRPFGIDLIVKGRDSIDKGEEYIDVSAFNLPGSGNVIHMGLQNASGGAIIDPTTKTFTAIIKQEDLKNYSKKVWFDVCLVLPAFDKDSDGNTLETITLNGKTYTPKSSDKVYTAKLKVTVQSEDINDSYVIDLTGTYNSEGSGKSDTGLRQMINVTPLASATSLNLKGLTTKEDIATFSYMTESKWVDEKDVDYEGSNAYLFLSSTSSETDKGETFKLRRLLSNTNAYSGNDMENINYVTFKAYITDSNGENAVGFDGTTIYKTDNTTLKSYYVIKPETTTSQNTNQFVRWSLDGKIQIEITGNPSTLSTGKYTETIYIHVVSPE